jgi:hypothetical protein
LMELSCILREKNLKKVIFVGTIVLMLMAGCTFLVHPAKAASVNILSHSGYHSITGAYWIWGELQNLDNKPIKIDKVTATFYDSSNTVIAVQDWHIGHLEVISPNQISPFELLLSSGNTTTTSIGPNVDHYALEVTSSYTSAIPLDIKVVSSSFNATSGYMHVTGEVENTGTIIANNTEVFVTCYDSNGKVVYTDSAIADSKELPPGQKSSFEIVSVYRDRVPLMKTYTVVAQAYIPEYLVSPLTPSTPPSDLSIGAAASPPPYIYAVWAPPPENAVAATAVTVGAVGVVAVAVAAGTRSAGASAGKAVEKAQGLLPDSVKKWLEEFVSSKRKTTVEQKTGSPFLPTKAEAVAYAVSLVALTISFSYVKVPDFSLILQVLPTVLATAVIVEFVKTYLLEVFARSRGVWTEHRLWYFGLVLFLVTTFAFGVPFSSPSRNVYHSEKLTKRLNGIIGAVAILVTLAFGALFFGLIISGFTLIGSTGLAMCIIMAFIDTFPMAPMSGKAVLDHNKAVWAGLFAATLLSYVAWLIIF